METPPTSGVGVRRPLVLVVDDDDDIRDVLALVLEQEGYDVETAWGGRDALLRLARHPAPDVIVLDLMMPDVSGWDVLGVLQTRPELASIPVLVVSAADGDVTADALGTRLLGKPIQLDVFLSAVEEIRRPRVLVVEDDADIRDLLALVLEQEGYEVETAAGGCEALLRLAQHPAPDVVVLDLMMPDVSGWDVLVVLRERPLLASIPVLVVSAAHGVRAADLMGARLLSKPIGLDAFLAAVGHCLAQSRDDVPSRNGATGAMPG